MLFLDQKFRLFLMVLSFLLFYSSILCARERRMGKLTETVLLFNLPFQRIGLYLNESKVRYSKER